MLLASKSIFVFLIDFVNLAYIYDDCKLDCTKHMVNQSYNTPECYTRSPKAKTYVLVYKRPEEKQNNVKFQMQADECYLNPQKQPAIIRSEHSNNQQQPYVVQYEQSDVMKPHNAYSNLMFKDQQKKGIMNSYVDLQNLNSREECECVAYNTNAAPIIHTQTQWVTETQIILETEVIKQTEKELETAKQTKTHPKTLLGMENDLKTRQETRTEYISVPSSVIYTTTESIPYTVTETSSESISITTTITEPTFVTVTRIETDTCTVEVPLTLYREVVSTVTSEKPIVNYKVTTLTDMSISYKTIQHTDTETETQWKTFTETEEVTITKTKTNTETKFEKSVDTKTETATETLTEFLTDTSTEITTQFSTIISTEFITIPSTIVSTLHETSTSILYGTIFSTFFDTATSIATETHTTTDLIQETVTATSVVTETDIKTETYTDVKTKTDTLSRVLTSNSPSLSREPDITKIQTEYKDITKIFIPLLERLFQRANLETKNEKPRIHTITQKEIQTVFTDQRNRNEHNIHRKTFNRNHNFIASSVEDCPVEESITYVTRQKTQDVSDECLADRGNVRCSDCIISDRIDDCPIEEHTTYVKRQRISSNNEDCSENIHLENSEQKFTNQLRSEECFNETPNLRRKIAIRDLYPETNQESVCIVTPHHQTYSDHDLRYQKPQRTVINTFYKYKNSDVSPVTMHSVFLSKRPKNTVFKTVYVCQTDYAQQM